MVKYYYHKYDEVETKINIKDIENINYNTTDKFGSVYRFSASQHNTRPISFYFAVRDYCTKKINERLKKNEM